MLSAAVVFRVVIEAGIYVGAPVGVAEPGASPQRSADEDASVPAAPPRMPVGNRVSVAELVDALEAIALELEQMPRVVSEYDAFITAHKLSRSSLPLRDFVRVKLVFESVRDGGFWQLRWAITGEKPQSDAIWRQWARHDGEVTVDDATATAECDELSALFAHLVYRLGVRKVGLFWPQWNHVVAVWTIEGADRTVRIVVPTSQIFLSEAATLGTNEFDPWRQKRIYEYRRRDVRDDVLLPGSLVRFFIARSWEGGALGADALQRARNERSARLGGS